MLIFGENLSRIAWLLVIPYFVTMVFFRKKRKKAARKKQPFQKLYSCFYRTTLIRFTVWPKLDSI